MSPCEAFRKLLLLVFLLLKFRDFFPVLFGLGHKLLVSIQTIVHALLLCLEFIHMLNRSRVGSINALQFRSLHEEAVFFTGFTSEKLFGFFLIQNRNGIFDLNVELVEHIVQVLFGARLFDTTLVQEFVTVVASSEGDGSLDGDSFPVNFRMKGIVSSVEDGHHDFGMSTVGVLADQVLEGRCTMSLASSSSEANLDRSQNGRFPGSIGTGDKVDVLVHGDLELAMTHEILTVNLVNDTGFGRSIRGVLGSSSQDIVRVVTGRLVGIFRFLLLGFFFLLFIVKVFVLFFLLCFFEVVRIELLIAVVFFATLRRRFLKLFIFLILEGSRALGSFFGHGDGGGMVLGIVPR